MLIAVCADRELKEVQAFTLRNLLQHYQQRGDDHTRQEVNSRNSRQVSTHGFSVREPKPTAVSRFVLLHCSMVLDNRLAEVELCGPSLLSAGEVV